MLSLHHINVNRQRQRPYYPNRHEVLTVRQQAWDAQMPYLYEAYIQYKYGNHEKTAEGNTDSFHIAVLGLDGSILCTMHR
jgi:hypothetical protein